MRNKILVLTFLCSIASGCCVTEHSQPELPSQVRGWQQVRIENGILSIGELVIRKGESVANDKFAVELVDVMPTKKCSGPGAEPPRPVQAKLKFYRLSDRKVLGEITAPSGAGIRLVNYEISEPVYGVTTVFVKQIKHERRLGLDRSVEVKKIVQNLEHALEEP